MTKRQANQSLLIKQLEDTVKFGSLMQIKKTNMKRKTHTQNKCTRGFEQKGRVRVFTSQIWDRGCGLGMIFIVTTPLVSFCTM